MRFDLLIKGGEIIDPATGYFGPGDVAVRRDRIAAVDRDIPVDSAFRVIDASGSTAIVPHVMTSCAFMTCLLRVTDRLRGPIKRSGG